MDPKYFESLYPENTQSEQIKKALVFIKGGASCQIVGLPGVGKSNLLRLLSYNRKVREKHLGQIQKKFHFVYMDFSEVRKRPLLDVTKFMLLSLSYSLSERGMLQEHSQINSFLKEAVSFGDDLILFQGLKKAVDYLTLEEDLTVCFLFDRFEQYTQDVTEEFFINLKVLRNRAKYKFSCMLALPRPLDEILDAQIFAEFYEYLAGNTVFLPLYDPVGYEFRKAHLEKITGKRVDEKTEKEIMEITGKHAKTMRMALEAILSEENAPKDLTKFLLGRRQVRGALSEIWNYLTPFEKNALRKNKIDQEFIILEQADLIKDKKITIPIFIEYIKSLEEGRREEIVFDEARNEILKDGEQISDQLSPSEFRLLRFLIQNKDRVIEKDELINAVWSDTKTQEGVTDQALDQIIYRLRKKIEDDPNNPTHIHTVKGKGVRFTN